jgi:hypothetical protein
MIRIIITVLITCFLFSLHSCNTKRDYGQYLNQQLKLHCFTKGKKDFNGNGY